MTMNLKLVTFDLDYTQFLVNEENGINVINLAIEANRSDVCGPLSESSDYGLTKEEVEDIANYTVEEVDMEMLAAVCLRDDYIGCVNEVIIFNG